MRPLLLATLFTLLFASQARAESILIVGDSLSCGHFGNELLKDLAKQGHEVKMYCAVGSRPEHWLEGRPARPSWPCEIHKIVNGKIQSSDCGGFPKLASILAQNPSNRVIVALGTNSLPGNPDATYDRMIDAVRASQRTCDWILPPHLEPQRAKTPAGRKDLTAKDAVLGHASKPGPWYEAMNKKLSGRCGSISSLASTEPGTPGNETGEGLHQTAKGGRARFLGMKAEIDRSLTQTSNEATTLHGHSKANR